MQFIDYKPKPKHVLPKTITYKNRVDTAEYCQSSKRLKLTSTQVINPFTHYHMGFDFYDIGFCINQLSDRM